MKVLAASRTVFVLLTLNSAFADELESLRTSISGFNRNRLCPITGRYARLGDEYCKEIDKKVHDACGNDRYSECNQYTSESIKCYGELNKKNDVIDRYNEIVRKCAGKRSAKSDASSDLDMIERAKRQNERSATEREGEFLHEVAHDVERKREAERDREVRRSASSPPATISASRSTNLLSISAEN
jgi:hypothetical protein